MWLTGLEADRLRNLHAVQWTLQSGLNLIAGRNGQGKTSLLEAVYLLGTGRSFRTRRMDELVAWEADGPLRVAGRVQSRLGAVELKVLMEVGSRVLLVDGAERDQESFLGRLDVVDLTAPRMDVLKGGPEERRRFLDRGIVGLDPSCLRVLGEYRRSLLQRNALLRKAGDPSGHLLDAWDARLVQAASEVHRRRREYAVTLASRLGEMERVLFPGGAELRMRYRPSPVSTAESDPERFPELYAEALARGRQRDRMVGHTCRGPHRDEMVVELDGVDLRKFGSAGQLRAALVALKLAKLSLLREDRGESPLFLMDDYDTDLDEKRVSALAEFLHERAFQTVVATSKEGMAERLGVPFAIVRMEDGRLRS